MKDEEIEDLTVTEIVNKFKSTLDQEIAVVKNKENDWTKKLTQGDKESFYELEHLIIKNIVVSAKDLHTALNGKTKEEAPYGHKWLEKLIDAFNLHNKRVDDFLKRENKMSATIDASNVSTFKDLLSFRNTVKDNQAKLKRLIKGVATSDAQLPDLPFVLHARTKIVPLSCKNVIESKYPEMVEYANKKKTING